MYPLSTGLRKFTVRTFGVRIFCKKQLSLLNVYFTNSYNLTINFRSVESLRLFMVINLGEANDKVK